MHPEAIQLETLRQKIEDALTEGANQSEMRDHNQLSPAEAKKAQDTINQLDSQAKALQAELKQLIASVRSQHPQALEEWINYHTGILQKILDEKATGTQAAPRRLVAKQTVEQWEKVRLGEQEYVNINWYFLKDYKAEVRTISGGKAGNTVSAAQTKTEGRAWWQFWK
jgi:ribosomal protein L16 Arg81 hydroxylase